MVLTQWNAKVFLTTQMEDLIVLNLRVTRTIALVVMLAGVLVFSGIADAHHISSEDGTWRGRLEGLGW